MAMRKISKSANALPPFVSKVKKMDKVDGTDAEKSEWIKLEFLMDPDNPALDSKYSQQFAIFKDGWNTERIGSSGWWPSVR
jgi:hypothetical protein